MKKSLLFLVLVVLVGGVFALTACGTTAIVPSAAWTKSEVLTYEITKTGGSTVLGTLVTEVETLAEGEHTLPRVREEPFVVTSSVMRGVRYKQTVTDTSGNVVMESETILDGFTSIASYKKVNVNDVFEQTVASEVKLYLDGKNYRYSLNGGDYKKTKSKNNTVDNEAIYLYLRTYDDIDKGAFTRSLKTLEPKTGKTTALRLESTAERRKVSFSYTSFDGVEREAANIDAIVARIGRTETPVGSYIEVLYTAKTSNDTTNGLVIKGDIKDDLQSYHLPAKIIENDKTYTLKTAKIK